MGQHRASAASQFAKLGIKPKWDVVIAPPEFPEALRYLWTWFNEVIRGVQGNGYSYPVISWSELDAWARMTKQAPSPREAKTIIVLGTMHANIMSEKPKTDAGKG